MSVEDLVVGGQEVSAHGHSLGANLAKRRRRVTWLLDAATDGEERPEPFATQATVVSLQGVLSLASPGDLVIVPSAAPSELIRYCESLLCGGLAVALDCSAVPALHGPLSNPMRGGEWVVLSPKPHTRAALVSRLADVIVSGIALIVASPFIAGLALAVRLTSPGPIFFRSRMIGRGGRIFNLYKFRSMRPGDCEADTAVRKEQYREFMGIEGNLDGKQLKVVDESRVTRLGSFMRKHSLDELPQFWNVLRGDLALVGARPCPPYEYDLYEPWHKLRFRGKPGLTGVWQAYGRSRVTFPDMVLMDYCYSWKKSFLVDLRILLQTALVVVTGEGGK